MNSTRPEGNLDLDLQKMRADQITKVKSRNRGVVMQPRIRSQVSSTPRLQTKEPFRYRPVRESLQVCRSAPQLRTAATRRSVTITLMSSISRLFVYRVTWRLESRLLRWDSEYCSVHLLLRVPLEAGAKLCHGRSVYLGTFGNGPEDPEPRPTVIVYMARYSNRYGQ